MVNSMPAILVKFLVLTFKQKLSPLATDLSSISNIKFPTLPVEPPPVEPPPVEPPPVPPPPVPPPVPAPPAPMIITGELTVLGTKASERLIISKLLILNVS